MTAEHRIGAKDTAPTVDTEPRLGVRPAKRPKLTGEELWDRISRGEKADLELEEGAGQAIETPELG